MRKIEIGQKTSMAVNKSYEGEPLEQELARITTTNQPIDASSPQMFTERKDGVMPETDIRTDRWDVAMEAMNKIHKSEIAKREAGYQKEKPTTSEPTQATTAEAE